MTILLETLPSFEVRATFKDITPRELEARLQDIYPTALVVSSSPLIARFVVATTSSDLAAAAIADILTEGKLPPQETWVSASF